MVVWPFVLRVYTKCPNCGEVTMMKALKPKIFGGKEKLTAFIFNIVMLL
ncbi:hypothetical protein MSIBF_A2810001 [groundwater metagenome]|uniref:Uncharacterized protein n=1 Tax=groundwater metagenome TaxID=717931 RepID=A0A098EA18_9ZZZZ